MIRNAYLKRVEGRLSRLEAEIGSLVKRVESASSENRGALLRQVETLLSGAKTARKRIRSVRKAGGASWGVLKAGVDDAIRDLEKGVETAEEQFRRMGSGSR